MTKLKPFIFKVGGVELYLMTASEAKEIYRKLHQAMFDIKELKAEINKLKK